MKTLVLRIILLQLCLAFPVWQAAIADDSDYGIPLTKTPAWAKPPASALLPELRHGLWLVAARVDSVTTDSHFILSTLSITHVYAGPLALLGRTFVVNSPKDGSNWNNQYIVPALTKGERGVFVVTWGLDPLAYGGVALDGLNPECLTYLIPEYNSVGIAVDRTNYPGGYTYDLPVRDRDVKLYRQAQSDAQTVEKLSKLPRQQQINLLRRYARSQESDLSTWAIMELAWIKPTGGFDYLKQLTKRQPISAETVIALDKALMVADKEHWQDSVERNRFWEKWLQSRLSEKGYQILTERISQVAQEQEISGPMALHLLKVLYQNQQASGAARAIAVGMIGDGVRRRLIDPRAAFAFLTTVLARGKEPAMAHAAAEVIGDFPSLADDQITQLQTLKGHLNDRKTADLLQAAMDSVGKKNKGP